MYGSTNQQCQEFITVITLNPPPPSLCVCFFVEHFLRLCATELLCLIKIKCESKGVCAHRELEQQKDPL